MALTVPVSEIVETSNNCLLAKDETWERVLLGDVATVQNGFAFKSSQFTKGNGVPLIRIRDVGKDVSDTNYDGKYDPIFLVEAGDLLIGMDGDFNCARWQGAPSLLNQRVCRVILTKDIINPKWLDYTLPGYLKAINEVTSCDSKAFILTDYKRNTITFAPIRATEKNCRRNRKTILPA